MMPARTWLAALLAPALSLALSAAPLGSARAALVDRGGGLVHDTERNITWLAAPALLPGPLAWADAVQFAGDFVHAGGSDWRLPLSAFADAGCPGALGFGCTGSQMGHLFHERLGGAPGESVFDAAGDSADELAALALFPALSEGWFWSWQVADDGAGTAFAFHFGTGEQAIRDTSLAGGVLLVHAGDLGAGQPVSTPPTLPLVLAASALMLLWRPRRAAATTMPPGAPPFRA